MLLLSWMSYRNKNYFPSHFKYYPVTNLDCAIKSSKTINFFYSNGIYIWPYCSCWFKYRTFGGWSYLHNERYLSLFLSIRYCPDCKWGDSSELYQCNGHRCGWTAGLSPFINSKAFMRSVQKHLRPLGTWACGSAMYASKKTCANMEMCYAVRLENIVL